MIKKTPKARTLFAKLITPGVYDPHNKGLKPTPETPGSYEVNLVFDPKLPDHQEFLEELEQIGEELAGEMGGGDRHPSRFLPTTPDLDENKEETGCVRVVFKRKAGGVSAKTGRPWKYTIPFFDHTGSKMEEPEGELANGSVVKVSYEPNMWRQSGLLRMNLRLRAVQIVKARYLGNQEANDFEGEEVEEESFDEVTTDF